MTPRHTLLCVLVLLLGLGGVARAQQERTITGTVKEAPSGEPIPGAIVTVKGTGIGAISEPDGSYSITGAPAGEVTLVVSSPGHGEKEFTVAAGANQLNAQMKLQVSEVIVIEQRAPVIVRTNLANGASTAKGEDVTRVTAQTVDSALQGKLAGANIQQNSGAPGGGIQMQLRGVSTINGNSEPLIVVDGVIMSNVAIPNGISAVTASTRGSNSESTQDNQVNRMADLNPNDIESIEVLKGASASALYGSKAANGVIIITTKRGHGGAPRVSVTQRLGTYQLSNTLGQRQWTMDEAVGKFGDLARVHYKGQHFSHEEQIASNLDVANETSAQLSGGVGDTNYFASFLHRHDPGIIAGTGYEKQSARLTLDHAFGDRLTVGMTTNLIHSLSSRGMTNNDNASVSHYMVLAYTPSFMDLRRRADGTYPTNPFVPTLTNPLQTIALMSDAEDVWRLIGSANASLKVYSDDNHLVRITGDVGVDRFQQKNDLVFPPELFFEPTFDGLAGTTIDTNAESRNVNAGLAAVHRYVPSSTDWSLATSLGYQYEERDVDTVYIVSRSLPPGQSNVDYGTNINLTERREVVRDQGAYLQEEALLLDDRLSILAAVRAEQSSNAGDVNQIYYYPKAAAAYSIAGLPKEVDLLRVRAAYGESGNQPLYGQKFNRLVGTANVEAIPGTRLFNRLGDPDIKPERQREIEMGVDFVGLDGRGVVELSVYQKTITDLLLQQTLAPSTGFTSRYLNGGELRNRGVELMVQAIPVKERDFEWLTRGIFSLNRSLIVDLPDSVPAFNTGGFGLSLGAFRIEEGESATQIVGYKDGMVAKVGDTEPTFRMSFVNNFEFLDTFGLNSLVDWQQGSSVINLTRLLWDDGGNTPDYVMNGEQRLTDWVGGNTGVYVEDASFVKVREIELYYDLPTELSQQLGPMKSARLALSGRNLATFTNYSGLDPEVSNFGNQPIARNIDVAPYPPSRSFWFSVTAGF